MAAVWREGIPGVRRARPSEESSAGAAALVVAAETSATAAAAATRTTVQAFTDECVANAADGGRTSAIDRDRDRPPTPALGLGGRREPEVDDPTFDRVPHVGCEARSVPGDVELRAERNQLGVDGDDAPADGDAEGGAPGEVVRDRVDLHPVRARGLVLTEGGSSGKEDRSDEDRDERGPPPARSPTHEGGNLTQLLAR